MSWTRCKTEKLASNGFLNSWETSQIWIQESLMTSLWAKLYCLIQTWSQKLDLSAFFVSLRLSIARLTMSVLSRGWYISVFSLFIYSMRCIELIGSNYESCFHQFCYVSLFVLLNKETKILLVKKNFDQSGFFSHFPQLLGAEKKNHHKYLWKQFS